MEKTDIINLENNKLSVRDKKNKEKIILDKDDFEVIEGFGKAIDSYRSNIQVLDLTISGKKQEMEKFNVLAQKSKLEMTLLSQKKDQINQDIRNKQQESSDYYKSIADKYGVDMRGGCINPITREWIPKEEIEKRVGKKRFEGETC